RVLEGLPWRAFGLSFHRSWFSDFLVGSAIGAASLVLASALATLGGGLSFSFSGKGLMFLIARALVTAAALFVLAALAEEALFRGYPLQTLSRAQLAWLGVLLTSVPFAAVHLWNPNVVKGFTFANTALAGIWLASAYLRTRSLWFPLGVHWAWNWMLDSVLGLPVSGITVSPHPLVHGTDLGPAWLTGGSYGIEGGAACTIVLLLSTAFVWRTRLVSAVPELLALTSAENPARSKLSILPEETPSEIASSKPF
ncbi:MAG TPA: type II CAAX endopeptidase family protein, partial [Pyrinomonadaceae bacterium]